jgi:general secretion pathway protein K
VRTNERGFVLVTVLLIIAFLFPLVLAFSAKVQLNLIQAENFRNSLQALRIARSGIIGAVGILKADDPSYDTTKDTWAMAFPALSLGEGASEGMLSVTIVDQDGKIPLNNLVRPKTESSLTEKASEVNKDIEGQLRSLISRLGGNPEVVNALIDWIDVDDEVSGSEGAESDYYRLRGYECKNGPIDTFDELLLIKGFDKELVNGGKLSEYFTIAPIPREGARINVNTAPLEVLYAVLGTKTPGLVQPLNESDIEDLYHYREEHEITTTKEIGSAIKISQDQLGRILPFVKVNSSYFTVTSRYTIGKVTKTVEAGLKRDGAAVTVNSLRGVLGERQQPSSNKTRAGTA